MFHSRSLNNKINRLHDRCLRIIYNDKHSNFEELLVKDNSVSIHHNNIHTLPIEIYKLANGICPEIMNGMCPEIMNGICPEIMNDIFKLRENTHYNLRHTSQFLVDPIHSAFNGSESESYLRPKISEETPTDIKNKDSLIGFKKRNQKVEILKLPLQNL